MFAVNLAQKAKELKKEKRKSDTLLFQMLPPSVAMQLKQTQQVIEIIKNKIKKIQWFSTKKRDSFIFRVNYLKIKLLDALIIIIIFRVYKWLIK